MDRLKAVGEVGRFDAGVGVGASQHHVEACRAGGAVPRGVGVVPVAGDRWHAGGRHRTRVVASHVRHQPCEGSWLVITGWCDLEAGCHIVSLALRGVASAPGLWEERWLRY